MARVLSVFAVCFLALAVAFGATGCGDPSSPAKPSGDKMGGKMDDKMGGKMDDKMGGKMDDKMGGKMDDKMKDKDKK